MRTPRAILQNSIEGAALAYFSADACSEAEEQAQALLNLLWAQYDALED